MVKNPPANTRDAKDTGLIPVLGRYPGRSCSSILAYKIPWAEEPDGLWSMRPQRVRQDWSTGHTQWKHSSSGWIVYQWSIFHVFSKFILSQWSDFPVCEFTTKVNRPITPQIPSCQLSVAFLTLNPLATTGLYSSPVILPFPESHINRITDYESFGVWLLPLNLCTPCMQWYAFIVHSFSLLSCHPRWHLR